MSKIKKIFPLFLLVFLCLVCCKNPDRKNIEKTLSERIGTRVILPDILLYRSISDSLLPLPERKTKVVIYINGECFACLNDFIDWMEIGDSLTSSGEVDLLFYVKAPNYEAIRKELTDVEFKSPFYIDPLGDILFLNNIQPDSRLLHTFLINRDNEIILIGSPINNPKMMDLYKQEIRHLSQND